MEQVFGIGNRNITQASLSVKELCAYFFDVWLIKKCIIQ